MAVSKMETPSRLYSGNWLTPLRYTSPQIALLNPYAGAEVNADISTATASAPISLPLVVDPDNLGILTRGVNLGLTLSTSPWPG